MNTNLNVYPGPYQRSHRTTTTIMAYLSAALVVLVLWAFIVQSFIVSGASIINGVYTLLIVLTSVLGTVLLETIVGTIILKNKWKKEGWFKTILHYNIKNYSYVTALIFALMLPANAHLYVAFAGAVFATFIGKLVFGGFGKNYINPAAIGRIFVALTLGSLVSHPAISSVTTGATLMGEQVWNGAGLSWITVNALPNGYSLTDILFGFYQGSIGETATLVILALGIVLIVLKVIDFRQPLFYLGTVAITVIISGLISKGITDIPVNLILHLSMGGLAFGAIFMITDPVTSSTTSTGRAIGAILAGLLTVLIRTKTGAVEGVMYSIVIVNVFQPLIDSFITGNSRTNLQKNWAIVGAVAAIAITLGSLGAYHPGAATPSSSSSSSSSSTTPTPSPASEPNGYKVSGDKKEVTTSDGVSLATTANIYLVDDGLIGAITLDESTLFVDYSWGDYGGYSTFESAYITPTLGLKPSAALLEEPYSLDIDTGSTTQFTGASPTLAIRAIKDALSKAALIEDQILVYTSDVTITDVGEGKVAVYIHLDSSGVITAVDYDDSKLFIDMGWSDFGTKEAFDATYVTPLIGLTVTEALALPVYSMVVTGATAISASSSVTGLYLAIKAALEIGE